MARSKRNAGGGAQSGFNKVLASIPSEANFIIPMVADSSNEVYVDIDTQLMDGEAWLVYGAEWTFENVDPTVPLVARNAAANNAAVIQIHRNDDSIILLNHNDDDLIFEDVWIQSYIATAAGTTIDQTFFPRRFGKRTITFSENLRVLFRTYADHTEISATTVQIAGKVFYDRISAPSIGMSKLGQIANL
jgi:hypothetical protein